MLKISRNTESTIWPGEAGVEDGSTSKAGYNGNKFDENKINDGKFDGGEIGDDEVGKKVQKLSKSKNLSKKTVGSDFLIPGTKLAFAKLRQTFVKVLIFYYFDPERYIQIEMDISGYAIGGVLSQLI